MGAYLMADDTIDGSEIRRGKLCWHLLPGMEKTVCNDLLMLQNGCNLVLNRFFGHLPCYSGLAQIMSECFMISLMGHLYEIEFNKLGLEHFTLERFNNSGLMKTSSYRFYMPAALAMLMAG